MAVVSFTDYVPAPRYDGTPWSQIRVEEAALSDGPWDLIDTIAILPLDTDPSEPLPRSFSTRNATLEQGWYRITFVDVNGATVQADPVHNAPTAEATWLPSVRDVALKILSRTKDTYGNEVGTFTGDTRPRESDAIDIIQKAALDVADEIGDDVPEEARDDAANLVALKAALEIERSYYSEQVNTGRSIYPQLEKDYDRELPRVARQISLMKEGETSISDAGATNRAVGSFTDPSTSGWMTRRW